MSRLEVSRRVGVGVGAALVAAFLLRLTFAVAVPPDDRDRDALFVGFNDEAAHTNYVRYLAENHRLPVQTARITDPDAFETDRFEFYQPPLYYVLAVPFLEAFEALRPGWGLYGVRLFSVLLAVINLALLAYLVRRFVGPEAAAVGSTLFLALLLGHARFSSLVSNDGLLWVLAAALFVVLFHAIEARGGGLRLWVVLGVITGLGLLTKTSFLTLMPGPLLAVVLYRRRRPGWLRGAVYLGISLALAAPWWIRNHWLYDDWLAVSVAVGEPNRRVDAAFLHHLWDVQLPLIPLHFWNGFGTTYGRPALQVAVLALLAASAVGFLVAAREWVRRLRLDGGRAPFFWTVLASCLGNFAGYAYYGLRYSQSEIRLMFPSLAGLVYLVLVPLYEVTPPPHRTRLTAALAACALLPWVAFL